MAQTFKNAKLAISTGALQDVYTCPALTSAIIIGCQIVNVDGSASVIVNCGWTDASDSNAATQLLPKDTVLAALQGIGPIKGKLVLEAGDKLQATASAAGDAVITVSVLEMS